MATSLPDFSWNNLKGLNWMLLKFNPTSNGSPASTSITNTAIGSTSTGTTGASNGSPVSSIAARAAADLLSQQAGKLFGGADSELGGALGNIFSTGISTGIQTMADNVIKGNALTYGLGKNVGSALSGTAAGLVGNAVGQGIESLGGHSRLSKGIGAGVSTGIGTVGGQILSNYFGGNGFSVGSINPVNLGMSVAGAALGAALGPSKEFAGEHGDITRGFDLAHNIISTGASFFGPVGQAVSAALQLSKGAANLFGSTDGMTKTDATLAGIGEFIAPVKWANTIGKKTTNTIGNESWQKQEARNSFLGGSYGDIGDLIAKGMKKSGKTYGTFSRSQFRNALKDIAFADRAKSMVEELAKQNEIQDIRSSAMASVNNQRYLLNIQGGPRFSYLGKQGMKITPTLVQFAQEGTKVTYEPDWSDKVEPYAAGIGLAGDAVGLGAAATGVGIPVGATVAAVANIPNTVIDGYQTVRDTYRSFRDNGSSLNSALWNGGEFLLGTLGLKFLSNINKAKKSGVAAEKLSTGVERRANSATKRVGTGAGRVRARQSAKRKAAYNAKRDETLKESTEKLRRRGVRPSLGKYFDQKLADEMSKRGYGVSVNDAIQSANATMRLNLAGVTAASAATNTYHIK